MACRGSSRLTRRPLSGPGTLRVQPGRRSPWRTTTAAGSTAASRWTMTGPSVVDDTAAPTFGTAARSSTTAAPSTCDGLRRDGTRQRSTTHQQGHGHHRGHGHNRARPRQSGHHRRPKRKPHPRRDQRPGDWRLPRQRDWPRQVRARPSSPTAAAPERGHRQLATRSCPHMAAVTMGGANTIHYGRVAGPGMLRLLRGRPSHARRPTSGAACTSASKAPCLRPHLLHRTYLGRRRARQ